MGFTTPVEGNNFPKVSMFNTHTHNLGCLNIQRISDILVGNIFFNAWKSIGSGQIIATSHDLTPNGGLVREIPLFQENLGW